MTTAAAPMTYRTALGTLDAVRLKRMEASEILTASHDSWYRQVERLTKVMEKAVSSPIEQRSSESTLSDSVQAALDGISDILQEMRKNVVGLTGVFRERAVKNLNTCKEGLKHLEKLDSELAELGAELGNVSNIDVEVDQQTRTAVEALITASTTLEEVVKAFRPKAEIDQDGRTVK